MSLKSSEKVSAYRRELDITVDAETFEAAVEKAYRKGIKKMNIPGFRRGKAPRGIVEKLYGENVFYEDALNIIYPDELESAIKETGLRYVADQNDFDLVSIGKDGAEFKITVTEEPEATVGEYKGITVKVLPAVAEDSAVDEELSAMAERNSRLVTVEGRAAENGDIAVIDFEGSCGGVPFEGGKGEDYSLTLGSGEFVPGFEEQVAGHGAGDRFEVNVTFPEDYGSSDLAGKDAVFDVTLKEIKRRELPELDDEFAKDVSEFDTLDELKADLKKKADEKRKTESDDYVNEQLLGAIEKTVSAEIPPAMITNRARSSVEDLAGRLQSRGVPFENYLKYTNQTVEGMLEDARPGAEKFVREELALRAVAAAEGITASDEELDERYKKMAEEWEVPEETVRERIDTGAARDMIVNRKTLEYLRSVAVEEPVSSREEAEAVDKAEPAGAGEARSDGAGEARPDGAGEAEFAGSDSADEARTPGEAADAGSSDTVDAQPAGDGEAQPAVDAQPAEQAGSADNA